MDCFSTVVYLRYVLPKLHIWLVTFNIEGSCGVRVVLVPPTPRTRVRSPAVGRGFSDDGLTSVIVTS